METEGQACASQNMQPKLRLVATALPPARSCDSHRICIASGRPSWELRCQNSAPTSKRRREDMNGSCLAVEQMSWPLTPLVVPPGRSSRVVLMGEAVVLPPLPASTYESAGRHWPNAEDVARAALPSANSSAWERVARLVRRSGGDLRVSVIGVSVTAGGGTAGPTHAWSRLFHDQLSDLVRTHMINVRTRIEFKRAVAPAYFAHCTESKMWAGSALVLVELAVNLWGYVRPDLELLLSNVQRLAPESIVLFVWHRPRDEHVHREVLNKLAPVAQEHGADMLSLGNLSGPFWADAIHPNGRGHALLAALGAFYIGKRLLNATCRLGTPDLKANVGSKRARSDPGEASDERCYARADTLPVVRPLSGSWELRNEGSAAAEKLGWVSTQPGDELRLGPMWSTARCQGLRVTLGYQATWRPGQGVLRLHCTGCDCMSLVGQYTRLHTPFPVVLTDTAHAEGGVGNVTVMATTSFNAMQRQKAPCFLVVRHERAQGRLPSDTSRVRVDMLTIRREDIKGIRDADKSILPWGFKQRIFASEAWRCDNHSADKAWWCPPCRQASIANGPGASSSALCQAICRN